MAKAPPLDRARIVAVARRTVEADGVEALSLRGVARILGVTAPALYAYVDDKADLLAAVAGGYFDELAARFDEVTVTLTDPIDVIRSIAHAYVDHALASPHLFRLLFRYPPGTEGIAVRGADAFDPATRVFETALAATTHAIDAGRLPAPDPLVAAVTMWVAVHGVAEVLLMGFAVDQATESLADTVIDTVLAGQGLT